MNSECLRITDQLRRAFEGEAWHGPSLRELLSGVGPDQARARPLSGAHSIWELVLHIEVWMLAGLEATRGVPMPTSLPPEKDWPGTGMETQKSSNAAGRKQSSESGLWQEAVQRLWRTSQLLREAIEAFGDDHLSDIVPGRKYTFYFLFHGIVQHSLYHAGQIALLKKT